MNQKGLIYGLAAYLIWGFFPLYFKLIEIVPAVQILAHRFVWSFILIVLINFVRNEWRIIIPLVKKPKILATYALAGSLLAINWGVYVWGVNNGHIVETSLGYFINPLLNVVLGVLILRERLHWSKWIPVGLATLGVLYLTLESRALPWIGLVLAFSFGLYGLVKKIAPLNSLQGLTLETMTIFLPALVYLVVMNALGSGMIFHTTWTVNLLLMFTGVITVVPLLMFGNAVRMIPLWALGFLQYVTPTCQFLLGVFIFHEPFSTHRLIGFAMIWAALALFSIQELLARRQMVAALSK
ncbi:MAG: EamA family transporter RarD [Anaerolineales bacterium]